MRVGLSSPGASVQPSFASERAVRSDVRLEQTAADVRTPLAVRFEALDGRPAELERAEATARETRVEFLTLLERIAQRIEDQLGSLRDPSDAATVPEAVGGGQVVALRDVQRRSPSGRGLPRPLAAVTR